MWQEVVVRGMYITRITGAPVAVVDTSEASVLR